MIPSERRTLSQTESAMHKKYLVRLSDAERAQLTELTRKGPAAASQLRHAPLLLQADAHGPSWTDPTIAESFSVSVPTVRGGRQRLVAQGLAAALNRQKPPPPARPPRLDGEGEARRRALRGGEPPAGHARGTLRLLADQAVAWDMGEASSHETGRPARKKMP